jgi:probable rRNA maturation factor
MYEIDIQNDSAYAVNEPRLRDAVATVLTQHTVADGTAVTIVFTGNDEVAALNRQYRGVDSPTDILSFPADKPPVEIPDEPPYLGDLIIAYPYASAQAQTEGHSLDDSLALLVVHGSLHLLGYDHDTKERRAAMWAEQEKALRVLNVPLDIVPALEGDSHDESLEEDR